MSSDLEIARSVQPKHITEIAQKLGAPTDELQPYGKYKAKLPLHLIDRERAAKSKLILVTAINPTPPGEGKTTTSIGLTEAMNRIGRKTTVVLREPSLGPVFGVKGGATGGGWSQVVPMEDINLHFTGDFAAIEKAHNLLSALIDNNLQSRSVSLGIDPRTVRWKRVMDMNDRSLRKIIVGLGGTTEGVPRETGFDITAASEIMAALCLSNSLNELKEKMGAIFVGYTYDKQPVFARDLKANGAMTALLKDAIMPNLVQTLEGNPAILHCGPFANIAQGTNSILATYMGLTFGDYVVTEAGFGADLGAEKFLDIKCPYGNLKPAAVVVVATVRALRYHGGQDLKTITTPNLETLAKGLPNLEKHLENVKKYGLTPIVAINRFATDDNAEIKMIEERCRALGVQVADVNVWGKGGAGAENLAELVAAACEQPSNYHPLYDWSLPVEQKIETIAREIYGAEGVDFQPEAQKDLKTIADLNLTGLPVCIAKTQKSLSDNEKLIGRPEGFRITVRNIEIAAGAGFLVPVTGAMMRMPGLPPRPAAENIDVDEAGNIVGLF